MSEKIRVMIIDDSAIIRNIIAKVLTVNDKIEVAGTAINGRFAIGKLNSLRPDIIICDLEMPEMNGIEFLKEKAKIGLKIPVIILSAHAKKGASITLDALSLGASDFVLKPNEAGVSIEETGNKLIEMILALAKPGSYPVKEGDIGHETYHYTITHPVVSATQESQKIELDHLLNPITNIPEIKIVAIGISTGGPNALRDILPLFPENFPVPILIVQHMPVGFTYEFANSLDKICKLRVKEAANGDIIKPGRIIIAQGNMHLKVVKKNLANIVELSDAPPSNGHRPSVDVLFASIAEIYGENSLACIMTGMGKDGAENIGLIYKKGGITIAQNQQTSIVFGMPKVAIEKGNINLIEPLNKIPETIIKIVTTRSC